MLSLGKRSDSMEDHLTDQTPNNPATPDPADDEPCWDAPKVQEYFGGIKPIHISTLYRGVATGIYPPPINVSPNIVRWVPAECRAARACMLAARNQPKPKPAKPRGRKRRIT
jgi:hypothetical protein